MHIVVYTDGGSRGNPGEGAIGVVIKIKDQRPASPAGGSKIKTEEKNIRISKRIGIVTNNEAEYMAVIEALKNIKDQISNIKTIQFFLDSSLVCNQLNGLFKVKESRMRELIAKIRELEGELGVYPTYHLISRRQNKEADHLVNEALDMG